MNIFVKIAVCSLPMAGLILSNAYAQEQTVEGAQKFLSVTLPGNNYYPGLFYQVLYAGRKGAQPGETVNMEGSMPITDASPVSRCVSRILFDPTRINFVAQYRGQRKSYNAKDMVGPLSGTNTAGFHWGSEVKSASQQNNTVRIMFKDATESSVVYLGDEAMAKRVIYAINFLRLECDPAAGTGF